MKNIQNHKDKIVELVQGLPESKLQSVIDYLSTLSESTKTQATLLSFQGSWADLDENLFEKFTSKLIDNRASNERRNRDEVFN
jgi:hypothetical protein